MKTFSLAIEEISHKILVLNRVIQITESDFFLILSSLHLFVCSLPPCKPRTHGNLKFQSPILRLFSAFAIVSSGILDLWWILDVLDRNNVEEEGECVWCGGWIVGVGEVSQWWRQHDAFDQHVIWKTLLTVILWDFVEEEDSSGMASKIGVKLMNIQSTVVVTRQSESSLPHSIYQYLFSLNLIFLYCWWLSICLASR